jgi:uncharacterized protein with von Willebrand factor type A (vWA) domain
MFAQTNTDRSLTPAVSSNEADANPAPATLTPPATPDPTPANTTNSSPDLSGLSREQLEARVKTLTDNLAQANADAENFRQQWQDLKLRDEALGVEALTVDQQKLEEGKVEAVAELYQSEMKRREAVQLMDKLLTSTEQLLETAPKEDPKVRADYEVASRAAKDYLAGRNGAAIPLGNSLADGKIADLNPELNAVILNLGKSQGVKEGMPFLIYQDNVEIGTVKIVLARELISAAMVESVKPNAILKVGDRATADVEQ